MRLALSALHLTDISSPLGIAFYSNQRSHVYLLSRGLRPERTGWIATCFRATSGERGGPCSARARTDIVVADIARKIHIPPTQETDCKSVHRCIKLLG